MANAVYKIASLLFLASIMFGEAKADDPEPADDLSEVIKNQEEIVTRLGPILKSAGLSGRIYYESDCSGPDYDHQLPYPKSRPVPFPKIRIRSPSPGLSGFSALEGIFREQDNVKIVMDGPSVVRIFFGDFSDNFIQTKISSLNFNSEAQYDDVTAVSEIWQNVEVRHMSSQLGRYPFIVPYDRLVRPHTEGLPHLPPFVGDLTIDQALDLIAKTFNDIIFYGSCKPPGLFMTYSYPIAGS